ncbi:MAG: HAD family hydrolase [Gammaproteobacteria bacterium]|nr:HAD family hydrolase [Gammaproteobacteria bacterium]
MKLVDLQYWIFDMDGTLTHSVHDFEAIRAELGITPNAPILEVLAELPEAQAQPLYERLDQIELELARNAVAQPGVKLALERLHERGKHLGIVTRNSRLCAAETLSCCELEQFFAPECIITRESATPKPAPDGVNKLLTRWQADPKDGVMVGDYLFDLQAGRSAGTWTLYIDPKGQFEFREHADACLAGLNELLEHL